jgi:hypothetical protein
LFLLDNWLCGLGLGARDSQSKNLGAGFLVAFFLIVLVNLVFLEVLGPTSTQILHMLEVPVWFCALLARFTRCQD